MIPSGKIIVTRITVGCIILNSDVNKKEGAGQFYLEPFINYCISYPRTSKGDIKGKQQCKLTSFICFFFAYRVFRGVYSGLYVSEPDHAPKEVLSWYNNTEEVISLEKQQQNREIKIISAKTTQWTPWV